MDKGTFGLTMLIVGMGGTLTTLYLITLLIKGLTHVFTEKEPTPSQDKPE